MCVKCIWALFTSADRATAYCEKEEPGRKKKMLTEQRCQTNKTELFNIRLTTQNWTPQTSDLPKKERQKLKKKYYSDTEEEHKTFPAVPTSLTPSPPMHAQP